MIYALWNCKKYVETLLIVVSITNPLNSNNNTYLQSSYLTFISYVDYMIFEMKNIYSRFYRKS